MGSLPATLGPYRVVRLLGEGGMGTVYEARQEAIGRRVAIKVLHAEFAHSNEFATRFFNEARAVNLVDHPGVVQVSDYGQLPDGTAYIVMEYLKGESLARRISRATIHLPYGEVLQIAWQIADTLAAAHSKGIVHRDLKPDNIMMVPDPHTLIGERAKVLDFGIAKLNEPQSDSALKTHTRAVMGTPRYMSPEQCLGASGVDAKSDVYALGCMMYELLSGQPPFVADGPGLVLSMHLTREPEPLRKLSPSVPVAVADLVHKLLRKDREQRPNMARTASEIEALFKQVPAPVKRPYDSGAEDNSDVTRFVLAPSTLGSAAAQTRLSRKKKLWLAGLAGATVMAALVLAVLPRRTPPPPPVPLSVATQPPTLRLIKLHVESEPAGVEVVQVDNGEVLGKTPWSMSLPGASGQLRLRLRLPGYAEQELSLSREESNGMQVRMKPQPNRPLPSRPPPPRRPPASSDLFGPRPAPVVKPGPKPIARPSTPKGTPLAKPPIED